MSQPENVELEEFAGELASIDGEIAKLTDKRRKLLENCPHSFVSRRLYFPGNYNDTAYTEYWDECQFCRKKINERTQEHSWYG